MHCPCLPLLHPHLNWLSSLTALKLWSTACTVHFPCLPCFTLIWADYLVLQRWSMELCNMATEMGRSYHCPPFIAWSKEGHKESMSCQGQHTDMKHLPISWVCDIHTTIHMWWPLLLYPVTSLLLNESFLAKRLNKLWFPDLCIWCIFAPWRSCYLSNERFPRSLLFQLSKTGQSLSSCISIVYICAPWRSCCLSNVRFLDHHIPAIQDRTIFVSLSWRISPLFVCDNIHTLPNVGFLDNIILTYFLDWTSLVSWPECLTYCCFSHTIALFQVKQFQSKHCDCLWLLVFDATLPEQCARENHSIRWLITRIDSTTWYSVPVIRCIFLHLFNQSSVTAAQSVWISSSLD